MENGHKWSWKVMENAHKKVLESHGRPLSVFCMHPGLSLSETWRVVYSVIFCTNSFVNCLVLIAQVIAFRVYSDHTSRVKVSVHGNVHWNERESTLRVKIKHPHSLFVITLASLNCF